MEGQLYELFYVILYKGLDYLPILVFVEVLELIPHGYWSGSLNFGGVKSYTQIFRYVEVGTANPHVVQVSTVAPYLKKKAMLI